MQTFGLMEVGDSLIGVDIAHLSEATPIEDLEPLMVSHPALLGAIRLRGRMIPVLDPRRLSGAPVSDQPPKIAAIIGRGDQIVGLAIDAIAGLAKLELSRLQHLETGSGAAHSLFLGGFYKDDRVVNVINPAGLIGIGGCPTAERIRRQDDPGERGHGDGQTYLTFRAGGASFAAPAIEVHRTLPRRPIDRNALSGDACLGSVTLNDIRVPVLDAISVLGLGETREYDHPEIVVIGCGDGRLVGLAVDVICQIAAFEKRTLCTPPEILGGGRTAISGVVTDAANHQTYVLNVPYLRDTTTFRTMADLSRSTRGEAPQGKAEVAASRTPANAADAIIRERRRNLLFTAGHSFAAPIEKVVRILEPPPSITPMKSPVPGVRGLFPVDGQATTLVCLSQNLKGKPPQESQRQRILLVHSGDQQIGFLVDAVEGIETSTWRAPNTKPARFVEQMVKVDRLNGRNVVPLLDIEGLAAEIAQRFQPADSLA